MSQLSSRAATARLALEIEANRPIPEWDSVPELKKWKETIALKNGEKKNLDFHDLVMKSLDLKAEIEYREKIRKDIQTALEAAMLLADMESVICDNYPVNYVTRAGSRKIIPEKLLENGVPATVIAACTETSKDSHFVQIGRPKKS
jgi:hypothetical protein